MSQNTTKLVLDVQASLETDVLDMHIIEKITKYKANYDYRGYSTGSIVVPPNTYDLHLGVGNGVVATSKSIFGIRLSMMVAPLETSMFSYNGTSVEISLANTTSEEVTVDYIITSL